MKGMVVCVVLTLSLIHIFLHIQGLASTETMISLQEVFQREINIDFIEE